MPAMIVGASDETDATDVTAEYEEIMTRKYPSYEIRKTCIFNCSMKENILKVFFDFAPNSQHFFTILH